MAGDKHVFYGPKDVNGVKDLKGMIDEVKGCIANPVNAHYATYLEAQLKAFEILILIPVKS